MSTRAFVKQLLGVAGGGDRLYRDRIIDAGFVSHFDFISAYCNGGSVAAALARTFTPLIDGAAAGVVHAAVPNGIGVKGLDFGGGGRIQLGNAFRFAADETHFAVGMVYKPGAPTANATTALCGYGYQTGSDLQWAFAAVTNATPAFTSFRFYADGNFISQTTGLGWMTDGEEHFIVGEFEVVAGTAYRRLYVDGVLVASNSNAHDGTLIQPVNATAVAYGPVFGTLSGFSSGPAGKLGRIWCKRWAVGGASISAADIAKLEYAAYGPAGAKAAMFGTDTSSRLRGSFDANRYG